MVQKLVAISLVAILIVVGAWTIVSGNMGIQTPTSSNLNSPFVSKLQNITLPPTSLPAVTYYYGIDGQHQTITSPAWSSILKNVFDNKTIISYNFANNTTQALILFDITYTGLNPYGLQYVVALSQIGPLSISNEQKAFWLTANKSSMVSGYTNWNALNAGAYPGFSWSKPKILPFSLTEEYFAIFGVIIGSIFVLYFVFNRRK